MVYEIDQWLWTKAKSIHGVALYYRNINNDGMCTNIRACQID